MARPPACLAAFDTNSHHFRKSKTPPDTIDACHKYRTSIEEYARKFSEQTVPAAVFSSADVLSVTLRRDSDSTKAAEAPPENGAWKTAYQGVSQEK
jgi:hypothetical protein